MLELLKNSDLRKEMKRLFNATIVILVLASAVLAYQEADLERGIELYNAKKYAEAERVLAQIVEAESENARAHEYLGLARLALGKLDEADAELSRAQDLAPASDSVKVGIARVSIQKKQFDRAEESLKSAREINGDNPDLPLCSGMLKLAKRDYKGAIDDLNEAIERKSDNAYAYYYAGLAYSELKRPDKMFESFQTFLKLAPDAPESGKVRSLLRAAR
jgi:tetratricopeptide (TPR) repeat protein